MNQTRAYYIGFMGGYSIKITEFKYIPSKGGGEGSGRLGFSSENHKHENVQIKLKLTTLEMCG